jgi:hypothetical protein
MHLSEMRILRPEQVKCQEKPLHPKRMESEILSMTKETSNLVIVILRHISSNPNQGLLVKTIITTFKLNFSVTQASHPLVKILSKTNILTYLFTKSLKNPLLLKR